MFRGRRKEFHFLLIHESPVIRVREDPCSECGLELVLPISPCLSIMRACLPDGKRWDKRMGQRRIISLKLLFFPVRDVREERNQFLRQKPVQA